MQTSAAVTYELLGDVLVLVLVVVWTTVLLTSLACNSTTFPSARIQGHYTERYSKSYVARRIQASAATVSSDNTELSEITFSRLAA